MIYDDKSVDHPAPPIRFSGVGESQQPTHRVIGVIGSERQDRFDANHIAIPVHLTEDVCARGERGHDGRQFSAHQG